MIRVFLFVLAAAAVTTTNGQFTCTLTNQDENSCLKSIGDDNDHCVWCSLASFGFCVGEQQAEQMEQSIPGVSCDRFSGNDDAPENDDDATPTPNDDDETPTPLPDNFWTCLQLADSQSCLAEDCTWCDSNEYKFGVCMTGPTAESASDSDFFTCRNSNSSKPLTVSVVHDPTDSSCLMAYLRNPTPDSCTSAVDAQGNPCEYCNLADMAHLCLTSEQADMGSPLGLTCQDEDDEEDESSFTSTGLLRGVIVPHKKQDNLQDPLDTACLLAFLQDPTEEACEAAVDSDGNGCEFCTLQGQYQLCLNQEQAMFGEQIGIECSDKKEKVQDPLDTGCLLAFLQDPTEEGCRAAADSDGNVCEYCTLQGQYRLCLNVEQAMFGEQIGMDCSSAHSDSVPVEMEQKEKVEPQDPLDTACLLAFLQDPTEEGCRAAADSDGIACEFCTLQERYQLCLNEEQAMYGEQIGMECEVNEVKNKKGAFLEEEANLALVK